MRNSEKRWMNGQPAPSSSPVAKLKSTPETKRLDKLWTEWANAQKPSLSGKKASPDSKNANMLKHDIWYATKGFNTPYPGERTPLTPQQVLEQPASNAPSPADN